MAAISLSLSVALVVMLFACKDKRRPEHCIGTIPNNELAQLINRESWTTSKFVAAVAAERGIETIPPLLDMMEHGGEYLPAYVRASIWWVVREMEDPDLPRLLIEFLERRGWTDMQGLRILGRFGSQGVEPLLKALEQTTGVWRGTVIEALGEIDDSRAGQALLEIVSDRNDPHWHNAVVALTNRRDNAGYSLLELANNDPDVWEYVARGLEPVDDKRLLLLYFRQAQSEDESIWRRGAMGIARNAGKAELPRIEQELEESKKDWVLPFVGINCSIERIESQSEKAKILWQFVFDAELYTPDLEKPIYGVSSELYRFIMVEDYGIPVLYALKRLSELGDVILPLLKQGLESDREEIRMRSIRALTQMPPSRASTKLLLEAWDAVESDDGREIELYILDRIARELGNRGEKRVIPRLFEMLDEIESVLEFHPDGTLEALSKVGDETLIPRVMKVWREHNAPERARILLAGELAKVMNRWKTTDPLAIPLLMDAMLSEGRGNSGPGMGDIYPWRAEAIMVLTKIGKPAVEALRKLLESEDELNKELAGIALEILNKAASRRIRG